MEGGSGVTRRITDKVHSWHIEGNPNKGESLVTRSIIDQLLSLDIQGDQM